MKKVAIASDHAGYNLKTAILEQFKGSYDWIDLGTNSTESVDYPDFGKKLAKAIINGEAEQGVLVCGSGIGISIAANRYKEIRAANCTDMTMARLSRLHNDANVVALGERLVGQTTAFDIIETFLNTRFEGARHQNRVNKL